LPQLPPVKSVAEGWVPPSADEAAIAVEKRRAVPHIAAVAYGKVRRRLPALTPTRLRFLTYFRLFQGWLDPHKIAHLSNGR
jgi:hypothetical protein